MKTYKDLLMMKVNHIDEQQARIVEYLEYLCDALNGNMVDNFNSTIEQIQHMVDDNTKDINNIKETIDPTIASWDELD